MEEIAARLVIWLLFIEHMETTFKIIAPLLTSFSPYNTISPL